MNTENKDIYISYWLLLITFLVALMIFVGGITRLTDSGLSITRWDLISGILPPLSISDWEKYFSLYKKIPEYKLLNSTMSLEQFKAIYWWEYIHRLLGRIIGISYLLPLLYFTYIKAIKKKLLISFYFIFLLIGLQGFIGWYMVESGLTERVDVSHYRLALHLTLAFIIYILLLWNYLIYKGKKFYPTNKKLPIYIPFVFLILILFQICMGAFVSGLDAGQIYNTWPLMNNNFFPDDTNFKDFFSRDIFEIPSIVQFIHRNIAYVIFFIFCVMSLYIYRDKSYSYLRNDILLIFLILLLQIVLGVVTLVSGAQIVFASLHQMGSILLITASLMLTFKNFKTN